MTAEYSPDAAPAAPAAAPARSNSEAGGIAEIFLLRRRESEARRSAYGPGDPGFREFELGLATLRDGAQIARAEAGRDTAIVLLRDAARLLVRARVLRELSPADETPWPELWALVSTLPAWSQMKASMGEAALVCAADATSHDEGERYVAQLAPASRDAAVAALTAFSKLLAAPLERDALAVRRVVRARWLRVLAAAVTIALSMGWVVSMLTTKPNMALNQRAFASDRDPMFGVDPKFVVDGDRTDLGFHTTPTPNTTLIVDVGAVKAMERIDVYNRADCCRERVVPLTAQISSDGTGFRTVGRTEHVFERWSLPLPRGTTARYVRLVHESAQPFHLSEVEIY